MLGCKELGCLSPCAPACSFSFCWATKHLHGGEQVYSKELLPASIQACASQNFFSFHVFSCILLSLMNLLAVWFLDYHNISFLVKIFKSEPCGEDVVPWWSGDGPNLHLKGTNGIRAPPQKTRKLEFSQIFAIFAIFLHNFFSRFSCRCPTTKVPVGPVARALSISRCKIIWSTSTNPAAFLQG